MLLGTANRKKTNMMQNIFYGNRLFTTTSQSLQFFHYFIVQKMFVKYIKKEIIKEQEKNNKIIIIKFERLCRIKLFFDDSVRKKINRKRISRRSGTTMQIRYRFVAGHIKSTHGGGSISRVVVT